MKLMRRLFLGLVVTSCVALSGCFSVDSAAAEARKALLQGDMPRVCAWAEELATNSSYSAALGYVEAGRARFLAGDFAASESWFRRAIDSSVKRSESGPRINLTDVGNTALAATVTDDRTRQYTLGAYELNLALQYGILAEVLNNKYEEALVDSRLAIYVQDTLAEKLGGDLVAPSSSTNQSELAAQNICEGQDAALDDLIAGTRNSWENPVLWWLTGILFETNGELDFAQQSYRKAHAIRPENTLFAADAARFAVGKPQQRLPKKGKARIVVLYDAGLVPMRESLKVPVPIYTGMAIDIPVYREKRTTYGTLQVDGSQGSLGLDVTALAARDLKEQLPGIVTRNVTRAAVQAAAQAAVNNAGNEYAQIGVFAANAIISALRRADTRSWLTLPAQTQVATVEDITPGAYALKLTTVHGVTTFECTLKADETRLIYVADVARGARLASCSLGATANNTVFENHEGY